MARSLARALFGQISLYYLLRVADRLSKRLESSFRQMTGDSLRHLLTVADWNTVQFQGHTAKNLIFKITFALIHNRNEIKDESTFLRFSSVSY